ncbi:hypothetical protein SEA_REDWATTLEHOG_72 [Gordonia phage RedWattleHog]|uniref:Uncharacterized protein n=1 Tax=Gordonia phage Stormageddon TaxID=2656541 RepID=A0A649VSL8_9CAUD|nr:hypothetical protein KHQ86_gp069 [Gordonia phage Stormageddon]QGJ94932.1 hypothetical protein SEA_STORMAGEDDON_69 [Gordonia phage Stormageddon]QLF83576.1 hypothetical protein SEA_REDWATTLEHOG_72 [Gordonia phage RedWattleHog]
MERPDPLERYMDCRVEEMTPSEMASYMKLYLRNRYNLELPMDGIKERKTFEAFRKRYPDGVAGRILQWVMMHHQGRKDGEYVTSAFFSAAFSWWTDKMFMELQQAELRAKNAQVGAHKLQSAFLDADSMA